MGEFISTIEYIEEEDQVRPPIQMLPNLQIPRINNPKDEE